MKRILLTLFAIFLALGLSAQTGTGWGNIYYKLNHADSVNFAKAFKISGLTVTTTGTQFNYLNIASGRTGTGSLVLSASPTLSGTPLAPTAVAGTNTTQIATTAFAAAGLALKVNISDTSAMLGSYINRSDTAGMLSHYITDIETQADISDSLDARFGNITSNELDNLDGSTSNIQTQLNDTVPFADALFVQTREYNILDYGAVSNDGVEDVTAIQAAVDAAAAYGSNPQGGTVIIPAGKWYITDSIQLKSYITIECAKNALFDVPDNYNGSIWYSGGASLLYCNVNGGYYGGYFETRTWIGINLNSSNLTTDYVLFCNFSNMVFDNCEIGIKMTATATGWLNGNTFTDITLWQPLSGLRMFEGSSANGVDNNSFTNLNIQTLASTTIAGIDSLDGQYNTFKGLAIYDVGGTTKGVIIKSGSTKNYLEGLLGSLEEGSTGNIIIKRDDGSIGVGYGGKIGWYNFESYIEHGSGKLTVQAPYGMDLKTGPLWVGTTKAVATRTVKKTIGWDGATGTDFKWAGDAGHAAQHLDLGAIIPAKARVVAIEIVCTEVLDGCTDMTFAAGNASGGSQFIVAASCDALYDVVGIINPDLPAAVVMNWNATTNIWIDGDPTDNNWSDMTTGKWAVYVTYQYYVGI